MLIDTPKQQNHLSMRLSLAITTLLSVASAAAVLGNETSPGSLRRKKKSSPLAAASAPWTDDHLSKAKPKPLSLFTTDGDNEEGYEDPVINVTLGIASGGYDGEVYSDNQTNIISDAPPQEGQDNPPGLRGMKKSSPSAVAFEPWADNNNRPSKFKFKPKPEHLASIVNKKKVKKGNSSRPPVTTSNESLIEIELGELAFRFADLEEDNAEIDNEINFPVDKLLPKAESNKFDAVNVNGKNKPSKPTTTTTSEPENGKPPPKPTTTTPEPEDAKPPSKPTTTTTMPEPESGKPPTKPTSSIDGKPPSKPTSSEDGKPPSKPITSIDGKPPAKPTTTTTMPEPEAEDGKPPSKPTMSEDGKPPSNPTTSIDGKPPAKPTTTTTLPEAEDGKPPTKPTMSEDGKPPSKPTTSEDGKPSMSEDGKPPSKPTMSEDGKPLQCSDYTNSRKCRRAYCKWNGSTCIEDDFTRPPIWPGRSGTESGSKSDKGTAKSGKGFSAKSSKR